MKGFVINLPKEKIKQGKKIELWMDDKLRKMSRAKPRSWFNIRSKKGGLEYPMNSIELDKATKELIRSDERRLALTSKRVPKLVYSYARS